MIDVSFGFQGINNNLIQTQSTISPIGKECEHSENYHLNKNISY